MKIKPLHLFAGAALLLVAVGAAFLRAWNYGIIDLDDYIYLTAHLKIVNWAGMETVSHAFTDVSEGIWMPLTWLSYALDYVLFGHWYGGFHIHSILIHAVNALLLWKFLALVFKDRSNAVWLAFAGALIWAVHPLRCESVVFVASRKDVLSFFWELLALIFWIEGTRNRRRSATALSVVFFIVGSMCKPSVMTFPVLCFLVDAFIIREVRLLRYIAPVAYMVFLGAFAAWQQAYGGATIDPFHQPLWGRVLGAAAAFGIYLRNFVWPQWLAPQCVKTWPAMPRFLWPGIILSAIWGWYLLKRMSWYWDRRKEMIAEDFQLAVSETKKLRIPLVLRLPEQPDFIFAGAAWFAIAVFPMLGIASFGYHSFADRFTYIPAVGLSIALMAFLEWICKKAADRPCIPKAAGLLTCLAALALVGASWRQTGFWKDDLTLFSRTLEVDGDQNGCAHGIIANWYFEFPHDLEKSVEEFEKALACDIDYVFACYPVYITALAESGHDEIIADRIRLYTEEVKRIVGPERYHLFKEGGEGLSRREMELRSMYYNCMIAWWLADPSCEKLLDDTFSRIQGASFDTDQMWQYQRYRYNEMKGNTEEAKRWLDKLTDPETHRTGYVQFRYLRARRGER